MTVTASFGKPFAAQVAAFRLRLRDLRGTAKWDDLWQAEHDRAFMVAGAMKAELLADLAAAVDKTIAGGGTLEQFRKDFRALVEKNGWHGWTGEGTKKGEAWRTKVIYRTNMATSYAAGRWAQIADAKFPFIVYLHGNSREPRLQHLAWDGLVLPADHPFWATHAPPNGWGCSCYVAGARSAAGARRLGGDPDKALPEGWQARDPRTGAPKGIDKGWAYAPGASNTREIIDTAAGRLPSELARSLTSAVASATLPPAPADTSSWQSFAATGRKVLEQVLEEAQPGREGELPLFRGQTIGQVLADGFVDEAAAALRQRLVAALKRARETGTETIATIRSDAAARSLMAEVAERLPADWVRAGNAARIKVKVRDVRGSYLPAEDGRPPELAVTRDSAVHEYMHHLQFAMPQLNRLFLDLHASRTAGDPIMSFGWGEVGRPDGYYIEYQGREYRGFGAMEVMTMGIDPLLGMADYHGASFKAMLKNDREMLEFVLGVLFYWR